MKHSLPILIFLLLISCKNPSESAKPDPEQIIEAKAIEKLEPEPDLDSVEAQNSKTESLKDNEINKIVVSERDSSMLITASKYIDHRIFGFEKPDSKSRKLILISIFTADVEGNPFRLPLGSFYDTSGMKNTTIKFTGFDKSFVKAEFIKSGKKIAEVFFEKKWVEFEKDWKD